MNRQRPRFLTTAACLTWLAACSASCSPGTIEQSSAAPGNIGLTPGPTIRVLAPESRPLPAVRTLIARHESANGVRVEMTTRARVKDVMAEVEADLAAKRTTYDLVLVPHHVLGSLVKRGYVRSLESFLDLQTLSDDARGEKDLFPGWWRRTSWYRGKPYGYPFLARVMSLWFRSDLSDEEEADAFFRKYRHPMSASTTWDEYEHIVEFMHRPESGRFGAVVVGAPEEALASRWMQYAYGFGAGVLDAGAPDEYGDIVVNSPEAVRATELYLRLLRFSPPGASTYTEEDALRAFQEGHAATGVMWHDLAPRLDDARESKLPGRFGFSRLPTAGGKRATLLETDLLVMPASAPHPREAFAFMQWAMTHEVQLAVTLNGGFSPRASVYDDPALQRARRLHMWMFPNLIEGAVPAMMIPEAEQIAQTMAAELSRIVRAEVAPKAGLDRLARRLEQMLAGKARRRFPN
jgi:multiple sugar transport system substrate-binding protein